MRYSRLGAVIVLTAGVAACGTQSAGGGQPPALAASGSSGHAPAISPSATAAVTAVTPSGAGSGRAGTASAAPPVTVVATGAAASPGTPSPRRLTGPATLTAADSGAVVFLRVGQQVTVELAAGFEAWHVPAATGPALRLVSASGGYPGHQPARAVFLAVAAGTATLAAVSDTACLHAHPACTVPQQLWHATVRVSGG